MVQIFDDITAYIDGDGYVIDKEIVDTTFRFFDLSIAKKIKNTVFKRGGIEGVSDILLMCANLENVVFDNFKCGRVWFYASNSRLMNVTFKGSKIRSLYMRPHPDLANDRMGDDGDAFMANISLDISKFTREVDMTGIDPDKIITNPSRHLKIDSRPLANWSRSDISKEFTSWLWAIMIAGPHASKASFGVYDIPKRELEDEKLIEELKKISDMGVLMNNIDDLISQ